MICKTLICSGVRTPEFDDLFGCEGLPSSRAVAAWRGRLLDSGKGEEAWGGRLSDPGKGGEGASKGRWEFLCGSADSVSL